MSTNNPKINITNSSNISIEIFDVYNKSGVRTDPFTFTSLGTIAPGATSSIQTIHAASQLQAMASGKIDGLTNEQENFPLAVIGISIFSYKKDFTITNDNLDAMVQTFNFVKFTCANPNAKLSQQFITALGEKEQETSVNTFFSQSTSFKQCTMITWTAITNWQAQFLSAWQGSFYLYDSSENITDITLVAGVNITVENGKSSSQVCMADANGKWSDASEKVALAMNGGTISEENPGETGISVSLKPVWTHISQKQDGTLQYLLAPTLTGTINNTKVTGNLQQISLPGKKTKDTSVTTDITTWLKRNFSIGLLVSAGMLFIMYKQWQESKTAKKNEEVNKSNDPESEKSTIEKNQKQAVDEVDKARDAAMPDEASAVVDSLPELSQAEKEVRQSEQKLEVQETLNESKDKLGDILEEAPPSEKVEQIAEDIETAQTNLDDGNTSSAAENLSDAGQKLGEVVEESEDSFSEEQKSAAAEVQEATEEAQKRSEEIEQAEKDQQESEEKGSHDDFGDDDFGEASSDDISFGGE